MLIELTREEAEALRLQIEDKLTAECDVPDKIIIDMVPIRYADAPAPEGHDAGSGGSEYPGTPEESNMGAVPDRKPTGGE